MNWQQQENKIRLHYMKKGLNVFLSPVWQQRVAEAYANSDESDIVAFHKKFWNAQPEYQKIFDEMYRELAELEDEYHEHYAHWNPPLTWNPNGFWCRYKTA